MEFYKFHGSKDSDDEHHSENDNVVDKFLEAKAHFEDQIADTKIINSDSEGIQQLLHTFSDILEDGFERKDTTVEDSSHYWSTVSSILDTIPMRFVNSLEKFTTDIEKAYVWILIELHRKNLQNVLNDILKTPQIMQYYIQKASIRLETQRIQQALGKLCSLEYTIESKFLKVYEENKNDFEDNSEEGSVVVREGGGTSHSAGWANALYNKQRISAESNNSRDISPDGKVIGPQQVDNLKKLSKSQPLPPKKAKETVEEVKHSLERYKTLLKRPTIIGRDDEDQEVFVRDSYKKELEEKNKLNPFQYITKVLDPVNRFKNALPVQKKPPLRKTSSFDNLNRKSHWQQENQTQKPNQENNHYRRKDTRKSSYEFRGPPQAQGFGGGATPMGSGFYKPRGFNDDTQNGLANFRQSEIRHMKNSQLLYLEKYQGIQTQYEFRSPPEKVYTAEEQEYRCFGCGSNLNKIMIMIFPRKNYCSYTGYWYCNACMAKEKLVIPWKVRDSLDFKLYHVCRKAREEIKVFYDKPNILIDSKSKAVIEDQMFYDTLVMKRQLHLIFDMVCEANYVLDLMGANSNLLLKINLFSLKNLSEIHNGAMQKYLDKCFAMLTGHIEGCNICQSKGKLCPSCHTPPRIFPYDIRNTSVCRSCKTLYHTRCLKLKKCIVCQHDS